MVTQMTISTDMNMISSLPINNKNLNSIKDILTTEYDVQSYSTPSQKKRLVDETFRGAKIGFEAIGKSSLWIDEAKRKKAVLETLDEVQKLSSEMGIDSTEKDFVAFEATSILKYEVLEEDDYLAVAASLWILDNLRLNGNLHKSFHYLPSSFETIWDIWIPDNFYHPCYESELIHSVAHLVKMGNSRGKETNNFKSLIKLLNKDDVKKAVTRFKNLQWEVITSWLKTERYFQKQRSSIIEEMKGFVQSVSLKVKHQDWPDRQSELLRKYFNLNDQHRRLIMEFYDYFATGEKKVFGARQLGKALDIHIGDPFEICFALMYLIAEDNDCIWLTKTCTTLAKAASRLLPWSGIPYGKDYYNEDSEEWRNDDRPFNWNGWLDRKPVKEKVDLYHLTTRPGGQNLAQEIFGLSRGIVPRGMHPFSAEREKMKADNIEYADLITDWAEILFLSSYKASASNLRHSWNWNSYLDGGDEETVRVKDEEGSMGEDIISSDINQFTESMRDPKDMTTNKVANESFSEELSRTQVELRNAHRKIKNLYKAMVEMRHNVEEELSKTARELKLLRMEHRELADLRELVFNQENEVYENLSAEISYPYQTQKRTVIFGGHETFLKFIRPKFPDIKFVDTINYGFDPAIVKNADVVWVQTNCIAHAQYGNIVKITRKYGIQLRYFVYSSVEKCAEQIVKEDQKR